MKLRTSYFNKTVFWKNVTRFAPVWGLYLAYWLLRLYSTMPDFAPDRSEYFYTVCMFHRTNGILPFFYAFLCAQVLFGNLYKPGICNALHAMPLRRESWFATNLVSGIAFSLVPTFVTALLDTVILICSPARSLWYYAILWMVLENLNFLCFFGIAVFSALCVGKRFAMALVYLLLNYGAMLVWWLLDSIYAPQLYGIQIDDSVFSIFTPMHNTYSCIGVSSDGNVEFVLPEYLPGILQYAAVGLAFLGAALMLYRRRNLECAGDFMAVRFLEPVFLVMYTLAFGAVFYWDNWFLFAVGIILGYFTGMMLIKRSVKIFKKRTFLGLGIFAAVLALTLTVTALDPLGVEDWIPEEDEIESATLYKSHYTQYNNCITLRQPEEIEDVLLMHEQAMADKIPAYKEYPHDNLEANRRTEFAIQYNLTNGKTAFRYYYLDSSSDAAKKLYGYFNSTMFLFESNNFDALSISYHIDMVRIDYVANPKLSRDSFGTTKTIRSLLEAVSADIKDGNLTQMLATRNDHLCTLYLDDGSESHEIYISPENVNTVAWLRRNNSLFDAWMEDNFD